MKKLIALLAIIIGLSASAADFNTITLTVTNGTTNGQTFTLQGSTRTLTNAVFTASSQILTNLTAGGSATNIFNQFGAYPVSGVSIALTGTNVIKFYGYGITASGASGFGTITNSTSTGTNVYVVSVPFTSMTATNQTNVPSLLVAGLNTLSQLALSQTSTVLSEVVGLTNAQTVTGVKRMTGANVYSNSAQVFTGGTISANAGRITNGYYTNAILDKPTLTNGVNQGSAFSSVGVGSGSEQFGSGATASGDNSTVVGQGATSSGDSSTAFGYNSTSSSGESAAFGDGSTASGSGSSAFGGTASASAAFASSFGFGAVNTNENSTALGAFSATTKANQIELGSSGYEVHSQGYAKFDGGITNGLFLNTNHYQGDISFAQYANSSLANGNNAAVNCGTNSYVKVSGPTTNFVINGIANGRNGKWLVIENGTGQQMVIANDSGVDGTSANRIYTGTSADVTNSGLIALFIYDSGVSRWKMISTGGTSGGGTSGEVNTASNIGGGTGIYASKSGADIQLKSLIAGMNMTLTSTGSNITASVSSSLTNITGTVSGVGMSNFVTGNVKAGSGLIASTNNGQVTILTNGAVSQTPLLGDIDAASTNSITNLSSLGFIVNTNDGRAIVNMGGQPLLTYDNYPDIHKVGPYLGNSDQDMFVSLQAMSTDGGNTDPRITLVFGNDYANTWRFRERWLETGAPETAKHIFQHDGNGNAAIPLQLVIRTNDITAPENPDTTNDTVLVIDGSTNEIWQFEYNVYVDQKVDVGSQVTLLATNSPTWINYTMTHASASGADFGGTFFNASGGNLAGATGEYVNYKIVGTVKFSGTDQLYLTLGTVGSGADVPIIKAGSYLKRVKSF